jgi:hypothetical protein
MGNEFARNIMKYRLHNGNLPEEYDWKTLKRLNLIKQNPESETIWPEYRKRDSINFSLIYVVVSILHI